MTNGNGNGTSLIGMAADMIGGVKANVMGPESALGELNILGMTRPLTTINLAEQLREQGGVIQSLQTGLKKQTAARKGGTGSRRDTRYRPPTQSPRQPATQEAFKGTPILDEEVVFI